MLKLWTSEAAAMRAIGPSLLCLLSLATILAGVTESASPSVQPVHPSHYAAAFNRSLFPSDFLFGIGSSAYQRVFGSAVTRIDFDRIDFVELILVKRNGASYLLIRVSLGLKAGALMAMHLIVEGAANIEGRGPSIWDTFTKKHPEKIWDHSTGDVSVDFYHRYKSDIKVVKEIGLDSYRFSISWSRIFPKGKGAVNPMGVKFYNNLINEILANGLKPFVTLFHWDLPQALEDEYGGFLSPKVAADFRDYADFCFKTFGDRVKYWATLNEPYSFTINGYHGGTFAPGRCSKYVGNCPAGDSATEPYIVAHHLILAHAAAAKLYKTKYQAHQKGKIGVTLVTHYFEPYSKSVADTKAASRALDFFFGWFANPITFGEYPQSMISSVGYRLPKFTKQESEMIKGSYDFLGVNYYSTYFAQSITPTSINMTFYTDMQANVSPMRNGVAIGSPTDLNWLYIYPKGIHHLVTHIKDTYKNPPMYITENGVAESRNDSIPVNVARKDGIRVRYHDSHLKFLLQGIKDGANVKGYYAWSFSDSYEWDAGYTVRFGIIYVDFVNKLKRYPKYSAFWLQKFLLK